MAEKTDKKEEKAKIVLERTYNIPLRRRWVNVPKYKRSKKAVNTLKEFLIRHMKPGADEKGRMLLKIGKYLNEKIWERGIRNPPHHIKVNATKDDKGLVFAELEGAPAEMTPEAIESRNKKMAARQEEIKKRIAERKAKFEVYKKKKMEEASAKKKK